MQHLHRLRIFLISNGLSDRNIRNARYYYDIAALSFLYRYPAEPSVYEDLVDLSVRDRSIFFRDANALSLFQCALRDPAYTETTDIVIISECAYLQLQRFIPQIRIRRTVFRDRFKERFDIVFIVTLEVLVDLLAAAFDFNALEVFRIIYDNALSCYAVKDREIELLVVRVEVHKKFIYFIDDFFYSGVLFVEFIYQEDRVESLFQRLIEHETCLRHRSLAAVHEQYDRIHSLHDTLDLRRKVSMSRCIDNINFHIIMHHRTILRIDRDASFSLYSVAVHNAVDHFFVFTKNAALIQKRVYQRRFAGVDMSDDSYIDYLFSFFHLLFFISFLIIH